MSAPAVRIRVAVPAGRRARARVKAVEELLREAQRRPSPEGAEPTLSIEITADTGDVEAARLAVRQGRADVAVLAFSTLAIERPGATPSPSPLRLAAVPPRDDAREALVSREGKAFTYLPQGAVFGVNSPRRRAQLLRRRSDLELRNVHGDLDARLRLLETGSVDALVFAAADLRLAGLGERIAERFDTRQMLPAAGQGALALEIRPDDEATATILAALHDEPAAFAVRAERSCLARLGGAGNGAIAVYAVTDGEQMFIHGFVGTSDGIEATRLRWQGPMREAEEVGATLAELLLAAGADRFLPGAAPPPRIDPEPRF